MKLDKVLNKILDNKNSLYEGVAALCDKYENEYGSLIEMAKIAGITPESSRSLITNFKSTNDFYANLYLMPQNANILIDKISAVSGDRYLAPKSFKIFIEDVQERWNTAREANQVLVFPPDFYDHEEGAKAREGLKLLIKNDNMKALLSIHRNFLQFWFKSIEFIISEDVSYKE